MAIVLPRMVNDFRMVTYVRYVRACSTVQVTTNGLLVLVPLLLKVQISGVAVYLILRRASAQVVCCRMAHVQEVVQGVACSEGQRDQLSHILFEIRIGLCCVYYVI